MSGVKHGPQPALLPLPPGAARPPPRALHPRRNPHQQVLPSPCRFLLSDLDQYLRYLCRITDAQEWARRRKVVSPRVGSVLDFQDRYHTWRRGVVVKTLLSNEQTLLLEMRIVIKGQEFLETVEASSRRLAPFTFFTRGNYLKEFAPTLPENDQLERELNQLQYKQTREDEEFFRTAPEEEPVGAVE